MGLSQSVSFSPLEKISDYGVLNGVHHEFTTAFDHLTPPTADLDLHARPAAGFDAARLATSEHALAAGLVSLYSQGSASVGHDIAL